MKLNILIVFTCLFQIIAGAEEFKSDFDLDKLDKMVKEDQIQAHNEIEQRDGADGPWMFKLFESYKDGKKITDEELQKLWEIYENDKNQKIQDKLYAFSLIVEFEDITKWQQELSSLAFSEDSNLVKTAIDATIWKLERGAEREKIILSNKAAILERLTQFAEDNKSDTRIQRDVTKISELVKPYVGKNPPAEIQRRTRHPESKDGGTTNNEIAGSSALISPTQMIIKRWWFGLAVISGIIIATILFYRYNSKSSS